MGILSVKSAKGSSNSHTMSKIPFSGRNLQLGPPRLGWSIHVCAMPDLEERRYGHDPGELRWPKQ